MLKKLLVGACLALACAACTTAPSAPEAKAPLTAATQAETPFGCVTDTGTRLPVKPGACTGFGAQYYKNNFDATGKPYAQQSLQMMDTTVKINGVN